MVSFLQFSKEKELNLKVLMTVCITLHNGICLRKPKIHIIAFYFDNSAETDSFGKMIEKSEFKLKFEYSTVLYLVPGTRSLQEDGGWRV